MATYKGKFSTLKNPNKYVGDLDKITYRSMWERNVMRWCDESADVVEWASEEIAIPYINPLNGKRARYYPDFYMKMKDGSLKVVEIKPKKQTRPPIPPSRKTKRFIENLGSRFCTCRTLPLLTKVVCISREKKWR